MKIRNRFLGMSPTNPQDDNLSKPKPAPSNNTHYIPGDLDAKMSVKPGKAIALNYLGQVAVDTATHMITHVQAFTSDKRDSECLTAVLRHLKDTLLENDLALQEIIAETGYCSTDALKTLQASGITGYIPNRGQFNFERDGFIFNTKDDYYQCTKGVKLTYKGTHFITRYWMKEYAANRKDGKDCPLQNQCLAYKKSRTTMRETVDKPYYDRMHIRMQTHKAKILMKLRQSTVEPVIGTLVNYTGIKRVNIKGLNQANKCLTMAAIA